jgi:hypothetical protein
MLATYNRDGGRQFNTENVLALYTQQVHTQDTHLHDAKKIFDFLSFTLEFFPLQPVSKVGNYRAYMFSPLLS